jgi:hypothetical protein
VQKQKHLEDVSEVFMDISCTINGVQVMVLFDIGTNISVVDFKLIIAHGWAVDPPTW